MSRATLLLIALLLSALFVVIGAASGLMRREMRALEREFAAERAARLDQVTAEIHGSLKDIADDLRFGGELVHEARNDEIAEQGIHALLGSVRPYLAARVYAVDGSLTLSLSDPRSTRAIPEGADRALAQAAQLALGSPGADVAVSRALVDGGEDRYRAFATPIEATDRAPRRALALLVDTKPTFDHVRFLDADALLLGPHGVVARSSSPKLFADISLVESDPARFPVASRLIEAIRRGDAGALTIPEDEALGLGFDADVIASFVSIPIAGAGSWKLATFSSTRPLHDRARGVLWRYASGALALAVVLVVVGAYLVVSSFRARVLSERLLRANELAQLNEISLRIVDHIPVGVLALAGDGRILVMNRDLRVRLPEATIGIKLDRALAAATEVTRTRLRDLVGAARATHEVQYLHAEALDLFGYPGRFSIHAIPLDEARLLGARTLLVIEDVTALERLGAQLMRAEKLATVGVLAAGIAHEIGTPLGVVSGRAEYIQGKLGPDHPQHATAGIIIDEIDRVTRTIRQLLDFARVRPAAVTPVSLEQSVRRVVELLRLEAERRSVAVSIEAPAGLPLIAANGDQLEQVVANLLMNAYDACIGGGNVRIVVGGADQDAVPGEPLRLTISDDGCGMTPEQSKRAFDPFYTTKKRGQGTGLGLTVVEQIVRNHGAQIELTSRAGMGTTVSLAWPVADADGDAARARLEVASGVG